MEPRTFSPSPVGTNFVVFAVNHATGSVLVDPSLPVTDIHASNTVNVLGLGHVFDLFGRQALVTGVLPYANADVTGNVGGNAREVQRSGLADAQAKLSVLLLGGRALTPGEFAQAHHGTVIGVSIGVSPTGQCYPMPHQLRHGPRPQVGRRHLVPKGAGCSSSAVWGCSGTTISSIRASATRASSPSRVSRAT
jgi:hypothetical protein